MNESQERAFSALDIGPIWRTRAASRAPSRTPLSVDAGRVFLRMDEGGGWLFVAEAGPAVTGDEAPDARDDDPMRLLGRMLAALGLQPAGQDFEVALAADAQRGSGAATEALDALAARIDALSPRVVVALGTRAAQALLRTESPVAALRGRVHEWRGSARAVPLVVSWHPSDLLEAPNEKAGAWADLCLARTAHDRAAR